MSVLTSRKGNFVSTVLRRRKLCREHFELTLSVSSFPDAAPGQFLQILCRDPEETCAISNGDPSALPAPSLDAPMLRRPFSIGGLRRLSNAVEIDILARVVGPGTAWLDSRRVGDNVDLLGPLGRPFSMPPAGHTSILVAGGIGLPPIRWHGEILNKHGNNSIAIFGAQSKDLVPLTLDSIPDLHGTPTLCAQEFSRDNVPLAVTTDDGTCGLRGRVTDALDRLLNSGHRPERRRVFACGPEPMLRAVGAMCAKHAIPCELAMERVMACGMGTCQSCVIPVHDSSRDGGWRYALCCTEGPVFEAETIRWG